MRNRELNQLVYRNGPWTMTWICQQTGATYASSAGSVTRIDGKFSRMEDTGSSYKDEVRTRFLNHFQYVVETQKVDFQTDEHPSNGNCSSKITYKIKGYRDPGYTLGEHSPFVTDDAAIQQALNEAFQYFDAGCADQETLLANFAWELPDVRSLWPAFRNLFLSRTKDPSMTVKSLKRDVRNVSSAYLAYNFGVLPLVGDCFRIYERLSTLDDHITWLKEHSGKPVKVEFRKSLPTPILSSSLPVRPTSPPTTGLWRTVDAKAGLKAWALLTYDVSVLTELQLKARTLIRSFGFNNPAAIIWEALPYSFVVDWFANVGDLLKSLEIPISIPMTFHDCGYGTWVRAVIEDHYSAYGSSSRLRTTTIRDYTRRPGLPIGISGLSLDTPSAKQTVLGLALIGQKF